MRLLPTAFPRREAIVRALVAFGISQPLAVRRASAATYTVVPTGSVAEKRARLGEVEKLFAKSPEDPYIFGEKAQLEYDIGAIERNRNFARTISKDLADGKAVFPQSLTIGVPNMAEAVRFWTRGVGCLVQSTRLNAVGANVTRIGFGPQSLSAEDGAKFALELVEDRNVGAYSETSVVQYVQLATPTFRLSQVVAFGGEIESAYGWTDARAPGGLPLRVQIDEQRRDPFAFIALRTSDIAAAQKYYEGLGMVKVGEKKKGRDITLGQGSWGITYNDPDATEPEREVGSVQMSFGDPELSTGLLLLPPKKKGNKLSLGSTPPRIDYLGKPPATATAAGEDVSPDGLRSTFAEVGAFEKALASAGKAYNEKGAFLKGAQEALR